jgi:hypothetical protein
MRTRIVSMSIVLLAASPCVQAQWVKHPVPGTPRTSDGTPDLSATAPRMPDGRPDLSGVWQVESTARRELLAFLPGGGKDLRDNDPLNGLGEDNPSKYFFSVLVDFKPDDTPLLPAAAESYRRRMEAAPAQTPTTCAPPSVPMNDYVPSPFKMVQTRDLMLMLYEADTNFRQIYLDGRKHPDDPQPSWLGYSIGRWDGDALVVEAVGFTDRSQLDAFGHTHSEALRIVERFHRRDFGHLDVQITFDDPKTFSRAFTINMTHRLLPDTDLIESFCSENEKDAAHMPR